MARCAEAVADFVGEFGTLQYGKQLPTPHAEPRRS